MSAEMARDFTEQLMIFEECGNIYSAAEFVQATDVSGVFADNPSYISEG